MEFWRQIWTFIRRYKVVISVVALVVSGLTQINYECDWTGFGMCQFPNGLENGYRPEKTLWDWLGLLVVPAVLALAAVYFNRAERQNELCISEQRAQDVLLQTYLDQMRELLLDRKLRASKAGDEVRHVAQTQTLIALRRLDRERRTILMQFLRASQLVGTDEAQMIVDFREVDLRSADLSATPISSISLQGADLTEANLARASFYKADLVKANLLEANLEGVFFGKANLDGAFLARANLSGANLEGVNLVETILIGANLTGANLSGANFEGAFLSGANLTDANLGRSNLIGADLMEANLTRAKLYGADLTGVNLKMAKVTEEQLECAASLADAIMPDGSQAY